MAKQKKVTTADTYIVESGDAGINAIVRAWEKKNPDKIGAGKQFADHKAVLEWFITNNNLRDPITGKPCTPGSIEVRGPKLIPQDEIKTPGGNPITGVLKLKPIECVDPTPPARVQLTEPVAATPAPTPAAAPTPAPAPVPAPAPEAPKAPLAQFLPNSHGTVRDAHLLSAALAFIGKPPQDAGAELNGRPDALRNGLKPGVQSGVRTNIAGKAHAGEELGIRDAKNELNFFRANPGNSPWNLLFPGSNGELEFGPGQHLRVGPDGKPYAPNAEQNQKMESGPRFELDAYGRTRTVIDMKALISENRRENPEYTGFLREAFTAGSNLGILNNTGEGVAATVGYLGLERSYGTTAKAFYEAKTPSAQDAEKLLQLNVMGAMSPLVWTIGKFDERTKVTAGFQAEMDKVVARLPEGAEKAALVNTYVKPYRELLGDSTKLHAAIEKNGGRAAWVNPMREWVPEQLGKDFIVHGSGFFTTVGGYGNVPLEKPKQDPNAVHDTTVMGRKEVREAQRAEAERVLPLLADSIMEQSFRPPTPTEIMVGRGELVNAKAQSADVLAESRIALLTKLQEDPKAREAWVNHMLATPGGMEQVSNILFYSSNTESANYQILNYTDAAQAHKGAESLATALAGEKQAADLMVKDGAASDKLVHFLTIGIVSPGKNRNQNNGLFGFQEEVGKRWADPATKAQVDSAFQQILARAINAEGKVKDGKGQPVDNPAATMLVSTIDPDHAENVGTTKTRDALYAVLGDAHKATTYHQMMAISDLANGRGTTERVIVGTQRAAANGIKTDTVLNVAAAQQLAVSGTATAGAVLATVTVNRQTGGDQTRLDAHFTRQMFTQSPASASLLLVNALAAAEKSGDKNAATSLRAALFTIASNNGSGGRALASLINEQVEAIKAAAPGEATTTATLNAQAYLDSFFASKSGPTYAIAASKLGGFLATDPKASGVLAGALQSQATPLLSGLPEAAQQQLTALAAISDPAKQQEAITAFAAENASSLGQLSAGAGISIVEVIKWAIILRPRNGTPDEPTNRGTKPGCETNCSTLPQPVSPATPVKPPPTPPVLQPVPQPTIGRP